MFKKDTYFLNLEKFERNPRVNSLVTKFTLHTLHSSFITHHSSPSPTPNPSPYYVPNIAVIPPTVKKKPGSSSVKIERVYKSREKDSGNRERRAEKTTKSRTTDKPRKEALKSNPKKSSSSSVKNKPRSQPRKEAAKSSPKNSKSKSSKSKSSKKSDD